MVFENHDYNPDACFRSYKVQSQITSFTSEEIREVYRASRVGYCKVLDTINEIQKRHSAVKPTG